MRVYKGASLGDLSAVRQPSQHLGSTFYPSPPRLSSGRVLSHAPADADGTGSAFRFIPGRMSADADGWGSAPPPRPHPAPFAPSHTRLLGRGLRQPTPIGLGQRRHCGFTLSLSPLRLLASSGEACVSRRRRVKVTTATAALPCPPFFYSPPRLFWRALRHASADAHE